MTLKEQLKEAHRQLASQQVMIEFLKKQLDENITMRHAFASLTEVLNRISAHLHKIP